jgi:epsilon-lactone hydrolase
MTGEASRTVDRGNQGEAIARGVAVPARVVPSPTSISAEARAALDRLVEDDGRVRNAAYVMPEPHNVEAWTRMKAAADAQYAAAVTTLAGGVRATVETIRTGIATVHVATPADPFVVERAVIDLHGGALVFGGGTACIIGARMQADLHCVRSYGVDYRTPPEHPYPAGLDDCIAIYRYVLERHSPADVVVNGRSAGGNLAVAMLQRARNEGLPMPGGLVLLSPQVDLTESGDSFAVNGLVDVVLPGSLMSNNILYANGVALHDPCVSPLFGDLRGFPATFLQSGTRDLFLSNTVRMHRALRRVGVPAELHVFEAMPHGGFGGGTPEDQDLSDEVARFVQTVWTAD